MFFHFSSSENFDVSKQQRRNKESKNIFLRKKISLLSYCFEVDFHVKSTREAHGKLSYHDFISDGK